MQYPIEIQRDVGTTFNADGGHIPDWRKFRSTWAAIDPLTSREIVQGAQVMSDTTHRITIRYGPGIHAGMRAVWRGRVFNFTGAPLNTQESGEELVILAKEVETSS